MNTIPISSDHGPTIPRAAIHRDAHPVTIHQLAALPFFSEFSDSYLEEIRPYTKLSYFEPGDLLLAQGELANRFYVILSGRVEIECNVGGKTISVQEIGPGEAVGFSWLFTPESLHFTARALEPVTAVFFFGTLLREDCDLEPGLGYQLSLRAGRVMMQRMEAVIRILSEMLAAKSPTSKSPRSEVGNLRPRAKKIKKA